MYDTISYRHRSDGAESTIGYAAHAGGAFAGFLVGINVLRNFKHASWEASILGPQNVLR
jgi:hypothetical protein